jgi:hypothetical protein
VKCEFHYATLFVAQGNHSLYILGSTWNKMIFEKFTMKYNGIFKIYSKHI